MNVIETNNLTKMYGKNRGISDINLTVKEGDVFGFIGPNGAGKSTTIRTLLGLISPTSGSAHIFGQNCSKSNTKILKDIGYLPSEIWFYKGMNVGEVIKLSADLHRKECSQEAQLLCERLKLDTKRKVDELSLGNRKKVGIVCAMQHKPKLYILDEPTSGLDPLMQQEFWTLLKERNKEGSTIFLSSHILSEVQKQCKNAAIIREGKIIVSDTVHKLSSTTARKVNIQGISDLKPIDGMKDIVLNNNYLSFLYQGDINKLLSYISTMNIKDITITEPDLEDIFLHYYEKDGE